MPRRVIKETHQPQESSLPIRNSELSSSTGISWVLGRWAGKAVGKAQPAVCLPMHRRGKLLANVYPLPQLTYNITLSLVNWASASYSLVFSAQLLPLLFLINMPELFRHLVLCYLWFVNMMFVERNHHHCSARAYAYQQKCYREKQAGRLEPQA